MSKQKLFREIFGFCKDIPQICESPLSGHAMTSTISFEAFKGILDRKFETGGAGGIYG